MRTSTPLTAAVLISALAAVPAGAQSSGRPDGMRFVPDATHAIRTLTQRPDALGFHIGETPDPSSCKHYQGMARVEAADGTPYLLVSRSGNTPNVPGPDDVVCSGQTDNGYLIVVRMGSRPKHAERLRSNRLARGGLIDQTPPPQEDRAVSFFTVVGGNPSALDPADRPGLVPGEAVGMPERVYQHPGGMALVGHMLALALESPRQPGTIPGTQIMFFDVSNPEAPVFKSQYTPINGAGYALAGAGVVAVTPLPGGLYLMMVTGEKNSTWFFYRSTLPDLSRPDLRWDFIGSAPGPKVEDAHQTLTFLREGSVDGDLYLAGARGHPVWGDRDRIDLYWVTCDTPDCAGGEHIGIFEVWKGRPITPFPSSGEPGRLANLAAAAAFHVTPSGELIFYATEHDNDGPDGTVRAGEWRNIEVVRDGSPTLMPRVAVNAPVSVREGGTVQLTGSAGPPITRPFIQLFSGLDFNGFSVIADIEDIVLEEWNDLLDVTESWNWYAPPGCRIVAADHDGAGERTLSSDTGLVQRDPDLRQVLNDAGTANMHKKVDQVRFVAGGTCWTHVDQPFALRWDLDGDGSFESVGSPVTFSAAAFDGPSVVTVPAQAKGASTGVAVQTATTVTVINVAPTFTRFRITDDVGNQVNASVPFVLAKVPVLVDATFRDAGRLDHQTATVNWGDNRVDAHTVFQAFTDAFGGGTGAVAHRRTYTLPGTYRVRLTVTDDDQAAASASAQVRVTSPEQAVVEIIALIDALIAGASTRFPLALANLQSARDSLAGTGKGQNGALAQIRARNNAAAIELLNQAIASVRAAVSNGANAQTVLLLLPQVVTALSVP